MLRCWEGGEFNWEGRFFQFRRIQFDPVPVQRPHPPLWVGARATTARPMRRAAKYEPSIGTRIFLVFISPLS
jgi:alkanesulfonate monooxygenase SsuD/methylene tetrahydromethanopterin reductase-like flavin-dependent oxidoreductase (luciferase family)